MLMLVSCANRNAVPSKDFSAESLRMGGVVYADFEKMLSAEPKDNDFTKFASDPLNYRVIVTDDGDGFIYTFFPKDYHGRQTMDGRVTYRASKDGHVELKGKL